MVEAINTFGVDVDYVIDQSPFIVINANTKLNTTKAGVIVDNAIGRLNSALSHIGISPSAITEADYPIAYENCQRIVATLAKPGLFQVMQMQVNVELYKELRQEAKDILDSLTKNPRLELGDALPTSNISPQVESVVGDYGFTGLGTQSRQDSTSFNNASRWDFDPTKKGVW